MTGTRRTATRLLILTSLILSTGLVAAPLATATASPSNSLAAHAKPGKGHTKTATVPAPAPKAAVPTTAPDDFTSIYSGANANLANSGWATCPAPIEWTVDTRGLTDDQEAAQIANLEWAFQTWSQASGLTFQFAGELDVVYNDSAFTVVPADGRELEMRHIYLDFVASAESTRLTSTTVGLGSPSQVMMSSKEIVGGEAVFGTDHVAAATTDQARSLYLHELGHVLGLAHAASGSNVMYPIVSSTVNLGAGDINGVRAMTKACSA
jgi:hypothetical protein